MYQPQPDGTKKLVDAMYFLPDVRGAHRRARHRRCADAVAHPRQPVLHRRSCSAAVRGVTDSAGQCPAPLVKHRPAPMIHVWITPHRCGPFAALEGVGAGKIADGETRLCDAAHGAWSGQLSRTLDGRGPVPRWSTVTARRRISPGARAPRRRRGCSTGDATRGWLAVAAGCGRWPPGCRPDRLRPGCRGCPMGVAVTWLGWWPPWCPGRGASGASPAPTAAGPR